MKFIKWFLPKTLKNKLRIALFGIGFLPYLLILIYGHNYGEKRIIDTTITSYHAQLEQTILKIEQQINALEKEASFLASLDIMNDIIVGDIDKRIARILEKKHDDLGLDIKILVINKDSHIIASSNSRPEQTFTHMGQLQLMYQKEVRSFTTDQSITMFAPVISSLQKGELTGFLIIEYHYNNLASFMIDRKSIHSILFEPQSNKIIGKNTGINLQTAFYETQSFDQNYLILKEPLLGVMSNWYILYGINKAVALKFLDDFILFIWLLFIAGFIIIGFVSLWIGRRILEPIAKLSEVTKSITTTHDYMTRVPVDSNDEISELAKNFNKMIFETNSAFQKLDTENKLRLLRFIQLIEIFNDLILSQSEEVCIQIALEKLHTLMPNQQFVFSFEFPNKEHLDKTHYMMLYITNYENNTCDFFGAIAIDTSHTSEDPYESKFYCSIATLIMLQLDQIRLIQQTKAVSHAKSTFISHMSHELRTPLHTILGVTQYLLAYEKLTEPQLDKISTIETSADHLLGMINDVLDLVQIEAGKVSILPVVKNGDEIVFITEEIITMLGVLAEQKDTHITFSNRLKRPIILQIDERMFKQILINLLSNAIKFTDHGDIDISIEDCKNHVCIIIKDSGIGISQEDLKMLFEDFTQATTHTTNNGQKGSGLGLAISRKLAQLFDAEVTLESEGIGYGSKATIILKELTP